MKGGRHVGGAGPGTEGEEQKRKTRPEERICESLDSWVRQSGRNLNLDQRVRGAGGIHRLGEQGGGAADRDPADPS